MIRNARRSIIMCKSVLSVHVANNTLYVHKSEFNLNPDCNKPNLIGHSMTSKAPVYSPSSILQTLLSNCFSLVQKKISVRLQNVVIPISIALYFLKLGMYETVLVVECLYILHMIHQITSHTVSRPTSNYLHSDKKEVRKVSFR